MLGRLARAEAQVRGVTRMVEADRYCIDILTQTNAAQAAMARARRRADPDEQVAELMGAVGRLVHR